MKETKKQKEETKETLPEKLSKRRVMCYKNDRYFYINNYM